MEEVTSIPLFFSSNFTTSLNSTGIFVNTSANGSNNQEECFAKNEGYDSFRFALVVYFGTPIAICGIISNAILIVSLINLFLYF